MGCVVHLWVDGVSRDRVDQLLSFSRLHLPALFCGDLDLSPLYDLGDDLHRVGGVEDLLEVVFGRSVAPGGVLEDVLGGDDVFQVALELAALYRECGVGSTSTSNRIPWDSSRAVTASSSEIIYLTLHPTG
jgi:hypothetical protein